MNPNDVFAVNHRIWRSSSRFLNASNSFLPYRVVRNPKSLKKARNARNEALRKSLLQYEKQFGSIPNTKNTRPKRFNANINVTARPLLNIPKNVVEKGNLVIPTTRKKRRTHY